MTTLEKIKKLVPQLPSKDIVHANKFIKERNFLALKELVDSSIIRIKRNLSGKQPKEEYKTLDLDMLEELKYQVDVYASQFDFEQKEFDDSLLNDY